MARGTILLCRKHLRPRLRDIAYFSSLFGVGVVEQRPWWRRRGRFLLCAAGPRCRAFRRPAGAETAFRQLYSWRDSTLTAYAASRYTTYRPSPGLYDPASLALWLWDADAHAFPSVIHLIPIQNIDVAAVENIAAPLQRPHKTAYCDKPTWRTRHSAGRIPHAVLSDKRGRWDCGIPATVDVTATPHARQPLPSTGLLRRATRADVVPPYRTLRTARAPATRCHLPAYQDGMLTYQPTWFGRGAPLAATCCCLPLSYHPYCSCPAPTRHITCLHHHTAPSAAPPHHRHTRAPHLPPHPPPTAVVLVPAGGTGGGYVVLQLVAMSRYGLCSLVVTTRH